MKRKAVLPKVEKSQRGEERNRKRLRETGSLLLEEGPPVPRMAYFREELRSAKNFKTSPC